VRTEIQKAEDNFLVILTTEQEAEKARLESVIEHNLAAFFEVGAALYRIREARLYKGEYGTFEEYCRARWDMSRNYVNKLIAAQQTVEVLGTIVPKEKIVESQVRPLTRLETPELQQQAWQRAVDTAPEGKVTARHVESVVREMQGEQTPPPAKHQNPYVNIRTEEDKLFIGEDFSDVIDALFDAVHRAHKGGWKITSRAALRKTLESLLATLN
jgi:hypothetical protein